MAQKKITPELQAIISAADAGHYATTVKLVRQFLSENPDSVRAWLDLGHALSQLARYPEAESAFLKAVELVGDAPKDVIYGQLGNLFNAKGDLDQAMRWYQKQIDEDPTDTTGYVFLANVMIRKGDLNAAKSTLISASGCELGIREEYHLVLGMVYRSLDELGDAKLEFEKVLKLDPDNSIAQQAVKDVIAAARP